MKNSGIEWIGNIPDDWETKTIKQLLIERIEKNSEHQTSTILSLSAKEGVTLYDGEHHAGNRPREDLSDYKVVYQNDIVVNSMNILSGSVGLSGHEGCVSPVYYIYYPRFNDNIEFLYYIFQCKQFQLSLRGLGNGILIKESENGNLNTIRMRIPSQKLATQIFPYCSLEEQKKIVAYLNAKLFQIDEMIVNQEKQIEKLKEYKQSVITEAVTKGLDKSAPIKDSGVEWISNIPDCWSIQKVLYQLKMPVTDGPHTTPELFDSGVAFVSAEAVSCGNGGIDFNHIRGYISEEFYQECCLKYIPEIDDVYMIKSGATTGRVSIVTTLEPKFTIWSPLAVMRANKNKMLPKFLYYAVQSTHFQRQVALGWSYGTQQNLGMRTLEQLQLLVPSLEEQRCIVEYLDDNLIKIDRLIAIKQEKIEKLNEYKKSLIYEYVTGKKEVV